MPRLRAAGEKSDFANYIKIMCSGHLKNKEIVTQSPSEKIWRKFKGTDIILKLDVKTNNDFCNFENDFSLTYYYILYITYLTLYEIMNES